MTADGLHPAGKLDDHSRFIGCPQQGVKNGASPIRGWKEFSGVLALESDAVVLKEFDRVGYIETSKNLANRIRR